MRQSCIILLTLAASALMVSPSCSRSVMSEEKVTMKSETWNTLSPEAEHVVAGCGTEPPFSGKFLQHKEDGTYTCARCAAPLFASDTKFDSGSGWPSFDDTLPGAVRELPDTDDHRVEIRCARCDGHLGHVFRDEGMTDKNTRHCVNSLSLGFNDGPREIAFFAGGCFWGVEHLLAATPGVLDVDSGYMGGSVANPSYEAVCAGQTGHAEAVRVIFDPTKTTFETLAKLFFEIHDPTQMDGQGPDLGNQYRSAVFFTHDAQKETTLALVKRLEKMGLNVATEVTPAGIFWPAEDYHQDYYEKTGKVPYCHARTPRF